jgi:cytochrome c
VRPVPLTRQAYEVPGAPAAETSAPSAAAAPAGPEPIAPLMAAASADAGKAKSQLCAACHTFDKGGPNRIGPNLYDVIGSPIAEDRGGFAFSSALTTKGKGQTWTLDNLNAWLWKPQQFAAGTKMTFIGLAKPEDRANVVAYLNSMSDSPVPVAQLTTGAVGPSAGAGGQAAAPGPGSSSAPKTPGNGQGASSGSSAVQGQQK